jgi:hypothetical protein
MAFEKMTNREQILIMVVLGVLVVGAYGLLRYKPQTKVLNDVSKTLEKNKQEVKNPKFPEEPLEEVEDLQVSADEFSAQLNILRMNMESAQKLLAPQSANQDMLLNISEAARVVGVKVVESVPYLVARIDAKAEDANKNVALKRSKQRRRDKVLKNSGRSRSVNTGFTGPGTEGAIPKEGELIYQLVNSFDTARPLQKLSVEGSYSNIQSFIQSLSNMQYQVTIVKLDIDLKFQTLAQGLPQPLMAKMIIAM